MHDMLLQLGGLLHVHHLGSQSEVVATAGYRYY